MWFFTLGWIQYKYGVGRQRKNAFRALELNRLGVHPGPDPRSAFRGLWLMMAANCFLVARQLRRREQLDEAAPAAGYDVPALAKQGRKIEAIKRYRELNPGVGLNQAKRVIDEL